MHVTQAESNNFINLLLNKQGKMVVAKQLDFLQINQDSSPARFKFFSHLPLSRRLKHCDAICFPHWGKKLTKTK